jgi:hypothetical protein
LEEKEGGLQAEEHHSNREAQGWQHHEERKLCGFIISQEVKAWSQMCLPNGQ